MSTEKRSDDFMVDWCIFYTFAIHKIIINTSYVIFWITKLSKMHQSTMKSSLLFFTCIKSDWEPMIFSSLYWLRVSDNLTSQYQKKPVFKQYIEIFWIVWKTNPIQFKWEIPTIYAAYEFKETKMLLNVCGSIEWRLLFQYYEIRMKLKWQQFFFFFFF